MRLAQVTGISVAIAGVGLAATGLWARREVRATLGRERIVSAATPVRTGTAARSLAESIRSSALDSADGKTYAETDSGSPAQALWLQATTLQTALMQAYMASRLAELTIGLGAAFVAVGAGLAAASR